MVSLFSINKLYAHSLSDPLSASPLRLAKQPFAQCNALTYKITAWQQA